MATLMLSGGMASVITSNVGKLTAGYMASLVATSLQGRKKINLEGRKLENIEVQSFAHGRVIAKVFGTLRLSGNIIWARPIGEQKSENFSRVSNGKGKKTSIKKTEYSYYATLAIALCEGEIDEVTRAFVDDEEIDMDKYNHRIYKGSESQLPDPLIEATEGINKTPAFRGLAYIVFENFPISEFNNRLPNLTFEVVKKDRVKEDSLEHKVKAITLIPGSGEFVYATSAVYKFAKHQGQLNSKGLALNKHIKGEKTNLVHALDHLNKTFPKLEWVSVVVGWFVATLALQNATLLPGVEYKVESNTSPFDWQVSHYDRAAAHEISKRDLKPQFGGTPADQSVIELLV
jgi:hypothetical protein